MTLVEQTLLERVVDKTLPNNLLVIGGIVGFAWEHEWLEDLEEFVALLHIFLVVGREFTWKNSWNGLVEKVTLKQCL